MKKIIAFIPNFLTLCNLLCGMAAIFFVFTATPIYSFWAIVVAAVFDFSDGMAARLLNARSEIGVQLDSLADMVSFGVAPAFIMGAALMMHCNIDSHWAVGTIGFLLAPFAAYRLAKFNIDTRQSEEFRGLATPAMALMVASFATAIIPLMLKNSMWSGWGVLLTIALCLLMVSDIPMFSLKFKNFSLKTNALRYSFLLCCVILVLVCGVYAGVGAVIALYIATSVVKWILKSPQKVNN